MPKIPQYQQGQLASSAVGVPALDTSGATLGKSIAQDAGNAAFQATRVMAAKQAQLDALAKQQKQDFDAMEVASHNYELDSALDKKMNELKTLHQDNPDEAVVEFEKTGLKIIQEYTGQIPDTHIRSGAYTQGLNRFREQVGGMRNSWAGPAKIQAGQAKFLTAADNLGLSVGQATTAKDAQGNDITQYPSEVDVIGKLDKFKTDMEPFRSVYGDKLDLEIRKAQEKAAVGYLSLVGDLAPQRLQAIINSRVFDEYIDPKSRHDVYSDAMRFAAAREKEHKAEVEYGNAVDIRNDIGQFAADAADPNIGVTPAKANELKAKVIKSQQPASLITTIDNIVRAQERRAKQLDAAATKAAGKEVTKEQQASYTQQLKTEVLKLNQDVRGLTVKKEGTSKSRLTEGTTPSKVVEMIGRIHKLQFQGAITPDTATRLLDRANLALQKMDKKNPKAVDHAHAMTGAMDDMADKVHAQFKQMPLALQKRIYTGSVNHFNNLVRHNFPPGSGRYPTASQLQALEAQAIRESAVAQRKQYDKDYAAKSQLIQQRKQQKLQGQ